MYFVIEATVYRQVQYKAQKAVRLILKVVNLFAVISQSDCDMIVLRQEMIFCIKILKAGYLVIEILKINGQLITQASQL